MTAHSHARLKTLGFAAVAATAISIGAAHATSIINYVDSDPGFDRSDVRFAMDSKGLPTVIYGAPQEGADPAAVAAATRLPASDFQDTRIYALNDADGYGGGVGAAPARLVLLFNAGVPNASAVCQGDDGGAQARDGALEVYAVFCSGTRVETQGQLINASVRGLDDPSYQYAMASLFEEIFPNRSEREREGRWD